MPKLRVLSAAELLSILSGFGFEIVSQKGSHIKVVRLKEGNRQVLTVPNHKVLDKGTLKALLRQASRFIDEADLHPHFYHEQ